MGLLASVTDKVSEAVKSALEYTSREVARRDQEKVHNDLHTYACTDCAEIRKYSAENRCATAVKKYKASHDVGESMVQIFQETLSSKDSYSSWIAVVFFFHLRSSSSPIRSLYTHGNR